MSTFYCFVILRDCILIFDNNLVFILVSILVTNQVILILVKISISLDFVTFHSSSLIIIFTSVIHIILSTSSSIILLKSSPYSPNILVLRSSIIRFGHLIAILILNSFLSKIYLVSLNWIIRFSKFSVSMSEMAFGAKYTIFMCFIMSTSFGLVFLINFWFFKSWDIICHLILIYRKLLHLIHVCRLDLSLHLILRKKICHLPHWDLTLKLHLL